MSQMRDEFEKAACVRILADHPDSGLTVDEIKATRQGAEYESSTWSGMWWAWQDSRACLTVRLPDIKNTFYPNKTERARAEEAVWWCKNSILAAGIKVTE